MKKVHLWGKAGCAKCAALHGRLDRLNDGTFEVIYHDTMTIEGKAEFSRHGSINGNCIPAVTVETEKEPISRKGWAWPGSLPLYGEYGLCTDYDNGGVVRPEAITWLISNA